MKRLALLTLNFSLFTLPSSAAVPLRWTVETTRAQPATFEAYQGETLAFEAALQSAGKPLELSGIAALYWQTNGMGSAYWETTAAVNSNRLSAVFTPEMDVGAKVYNCFIGIPGTVYHAAFQLRLRPSPGAEPNTLPLPVPVIDFAKVRVLNPPWGSGGGGGVDTNAVRDIIRDEITPATNRLNQTLTDAIDAKRDKDDLNVYECVTNNTENTDLEVASNVIDRLATTNGVNAAIEAHHDDTKRDLTDNTCYETEFGEWSIPKSHETLLVEPQPKWNGVQGIEWIWSAGSYMYEATGTKNSTELDFYDPNPEVYDHFTSKRAAVCSSNDTFVTWTPMTNAIAEIARTVTPPPSPNLRVYDEVRQCYWIGKMVNGVINWEVE